MRDKPFLREEICDCCGKNFIPTAQYAYKEMYRGYTKWFCKYSCMLKYREEHKSIKQRRKEDERNSI